MTGRDDAVVVGVDDGLLRLRVLDRAIAEARRRGRRVCLVHAHGPETPPAPWHDDGGRRAEAYLARVAPDLVVGLACRVGDVTGNLVGACGPGSVLILGDRHRRLGSEAGRTTERAVAEAPCPVLVIPEYRGPTPRGVVNRRAVVVGVDDGTHAAAVLAVALRSAADLDVPLEAVRVVASGEGAGTADADEVAEVPDVADVPEADLAAAQRELDAAVAAARRSASAVPVSTTVVADRPARALLERAAGADELVIGHRRHTPDATMRGPGSTARSVLLGMTCPVVVLGPGALQGTAVGVPESVR
ncbi:universal stress protein [Actinomycetospora cinnamomea]|uniref:Nucleotide-binding universal stress UspA family protein n=1 Tax=Actinomycetospora cinnamomea TaxID=663609 RepID=A0A2U1F3S4_9PSEU|nr:universal stress protein [Actinomycetospora cinnamomea]PVZ06812.1 nucleotide-binding universal stress UspA family protein [Actinomycetospora cinnamomea]